jgi:hypothetical protein
MPPIFPPRSNTFARVSILVGLILVAAITALAVVYVHSSTFNRVGVDVAQPVPFPHAWHVSVVGLDCRYCHESVDKSSFAGMPPTETCMSCHSQIKTNSALLKPIRDSWASGKPVEWNRVNKVADFVYFDHHIHVSKGIGCESCHGRVDQMTTDVKANTFYMAWCLQCHRDPSKFIRPKDQVYKMGYTPAEDQSTLGAKLVKEYNVLPSSQLMNCSTCHR